MVLKDKDTRCIRCGHQWNSVVDIPKQCPRCKFFKVNGKPVVEKIKDSEAPIYIEPEQKPIEENKTMETKQTIKLEQEWF